MEVSVRLTLVTIASASHGVLDKSDTGAGVEYFLQTDNWYAEVASLWEMRIPNLGETRVRIMPNACVDIVVYVSDTSRGEGEAGIVAPPHRSYVVGSTLRAFIVRSAGWRRVVGASILPAGVEPLLGLPARVIGESVALLSDVIGSRATELEERVIAGGASSGAMQRMADVLSERLRSERGDAVIDRAVRRLRRQGGKTRIDDVAGDINVSTRRLERHFLEHVGVTAKTFSRLLRFDRAVRAIAARGATSWSQFALAHGYSDQAHFINEFREFAGITPAQFEAESRGAVPDDPGT
jgi:AraC-like DNA-binding protein